MAMNSNAYAFITSFLTLSLLLAAVAASPPCGAEFSGDDHSSPFPSPVAPLASCRVLEDSGDDQPRKLEYDFYRDSCPNAEKIIFEVMSEAVEEDEKITARLLRLMFHDCFIQGCDASVLLDDSRGNQSHPIEKNAIPNQTLKGFDVIDRIKEAVEAECPNTVSCAEIISLATRNAIVLSMGPFYPVLTGRRDSLESHHDDATNQIPRPEGNLNATLLLFAQRGFNEKEVVSLLGAHNIGQIGCQFIRSRLTNFQDTGKADHNIPADFALELNRLCPADASPSPSPSKLRNLIESNSGLSFHQSLAPFIFSGTGFDTHYYKELLLGRGKLFSDQMLMKDERTARVVRVFASDDGSSFRREFAKAMLKMSNLQPPAGSKGEIRTRCSLPNSN